MKVHIYVEGGARGDLSTRCRRGFKTLFDKAGLPKLKILACGSRGEAYKDFCVALKRKEPDVFPLLLVDSEAIVSDIDQPWEHLHQREGDHWSKPDGASNDHVHLMVQCMEAWFVTDRGALCVYFGGNFRESVLPARTDVEEIPKNGLFSSLKEATRNTTKGAYGKGRHSFELLALIDPSKVVDASPAAKRLVGFLEAKTAN